MEELTEIYNSPKSIVRRRLFRDWKELEAQKDELTTVTAMPTSDMLVWHCNLRPNDGPFSGTVFHLVLRFPWDYPISPPQVELCTFLKHPNVYDDWICLDMLQSRYTNKPYSGWSSAYSLFSILLQLQSFLFAENIPQDESEGGGFRRAHTDPFQIGRARSEAVGFVYPDIKAHDGSIVEHTHSCPWPPLKNVSHPINGTCMYQRLDPSRPLYSEILPPVNEAARSIGKPIEANGSNIAASIPRELVKTGFDTAIGLPSYIYTYVFSFLGPRELLKVRDVCCHWRRIVFTYNLFDRTQIMCFHSKVTLDDPADTILGFGLSVIYYGGGKTLKEATSPLDLLSWHAFNVENVRTGVWGGETERFDHFLPLVFNKRHADKAATLMEKTIFTIMSNCQLPGLENLGSRHSQFCPQMAFQLLAVLMNSMVVRLMDSSSSQVHRHASETALEGYCAFHYSLLYFAKKYPSLIGLANNQIGSFLKCEEARIKRATPNLGLLLVSLTLSQKGWDSLMKPLVMEVFDRNVRWNLQKDPSLGNHFLPDADRLDKTFAATITSLRLLMFQVHFMSTIGRPAGTSGPFDILDNYEKRLGKPTTAQKEDLLMNAKEILAVKTWNEFFLRLGGGAPTWQRLVGILKQAVENSKRKGYHKPSRKNTNGKQNRSPSGKYTRRGSSGRYGHSRGR
mmetsp:Transcript_28826/g.32313  ORF Transcript_28826/g.32313 Transcript_28826/m.32313 type:complete len:679 (+) Transcript_28826:102-2138(+)